MSRGPVLQVASTVRTLSPRKIRSIARLPVPFGVLAADDGCVAQIHECVRMATFRPGGGKIVRIVTQDDLERVAVGFSEAGLPRPDHFHAFDMQDLAASAKRLLDEVDEGLWLPMAAQFPGFRGLVSEKLIRKSATENTLFTIATAMPNAVPTPFALPWIVGEFVLDSVFLSLNRVRLRLLLAAAHGRDLGIKERALNTASAVTATVGWRALARRLSWRTLTHSFGWRNLLNAFGWLTAVRSVLWRLILNAFGLRSMMRLVVSRIPFGAGLIAKGAVAFAGTYSAGRATEYWYRERRRLGRAAKRKLFEEAQEIGREAAERIAKDIRAPS